MSPNTANGALLRAFLDKGAFVEVAAPTPARPGGRSPALAAAAAAGIAFLSVVVASAPELPEQPHDHVHPDVAAYSQVVPAVEAPTQSAEEVAARQARLLDRVNGNALPRLDDDLAIFPVDDPTKSAFERLKDAGFNSSSAKLAEGVHPDMVTIMIEARKRVGLDVQVVPESGGLRTLTMQRLLVKRGNSWTLNSNHRTGRAVDLVVYKSGVAMFGDLGGLRQIAEAMMAVAGELEVDLGWGGNWRSKVDMYHYELPRNHIALADRARPDVEEDPQPVQVAYGR